MSDERPKRLKLYTITAQAMIHVFEDGKRLDIVEGIPKGADLHNHGYHPERETFYMTVEHESFDLINEGEGIPDGTCVIEDREDTYE